MSAPRSERSRSKPEWQLGLVRERIEMLFMQAEKAFPDHPDRSRRYVEMALRVSMRYNVRLSPGLRRRFCSSCRSYLVPGANCVVRASPSQKAVIQTCGECGHVQRHPYRRERSRSHLTPKPNK